ncbi:GGDEF domain-containing protein [Defluviitalea phaphyphila]|uniref:GGDEF domain-containing protein n=1 Tax=Defluviitalea phaphyphila TaxID=1473580 RepID=UPI000731A541|nr:GGDEF domain-containing protein [Defluviitalea phaphyphila]
MIRKVVDILQKNFIKVDVLYGGTRIRDIFKKEGIECFIVYEENRLVGIITKDELIDAHPNRIAADIMSYKYLCVEYNTYMWEVKELFDSNSNIEIILVEKEHEVIGYISRRALNLELGKYMDELTGLYRKEYMFFNAYKYIQEKRYVSILFIDLNNFGFIDKEYGHIIGDKILQGVAKILKQNIPSNFCLCRYAGDEFGIVAPYHIKEVKPFAKKIIESIKIHKFLNNIQVSASIGVTFCIIKNRKIKNMSHLLNKLINSASLASTKAKKVDKSMVIKDIIIDEIA